MSISFSLIARLRFRQVRKERVARRIESLSGAAGDMRAPAVSVFRRGGTAGRSKIIAKAPGGGPRTTIAGAVNAPTARMWAPANQNALSTGQAGLLLS